MRDLPPPVGMIATTSRLSSTAITASRCSSDLNVSNPKCLRSARNAIDLTSSGACACDAEDANTSPCAASSSIRSLLSLLTAAAAASTAVAAVVVADRCAESDGRRRLISRCSPAATVGPDDSGGTNLLLRLFCTGCFGPARPALDDSDNDSDSCRGGAECDGGGGSGSGVDVGVTSSSTCTGFRVSPVLFGVRFLADAPLLRGLC